MKDQLRQIAERAGSQSDARRLAREYLQAHILGALQRAGAMVPLAFHGGTCLRFLYRLARFSEDLDFALERQDSRFDFHQYVRAIQQDLEVMGYAAELRVNDRGVVHSAFVRFPGLLYELGLSPHSNEILAVKIEVDTNPPAGAGLATTTVRRHVLLRVQHHDRSSLFAGKMQALLQRDYTKGRDLYDLMWYLADADWPEPNLVMLNNALRQSGYDGPPLEPSTWRETLVRRLETIDWERAVTDVTPFLERREDVDLLRREHVLALLREN